MEPSVVVVLLGAALAVLAVVLGKTPAPEPEPVPVRVDRED
jgi:hypothetical protein